MPPPGRAYGITSRIIFTFWYNSDLRKKTEFLNKAELISLIEKKFANKFWVVVYNKKLFLTVVGLEREDQADCLLAVTILHDKNCDDEHKTWIELKKSSTKAAKITLMQEKALTFLSNTAIQKRSEAIATTNLFGVDIPVKRANATATEATSAAMALTSTSNVGMQGVLSILPMIS
jgi:hypothetical protein